mgnify:CR=1 FL=1
MFVEIIIFVVGNRNGIVVSAVVYLSISLSIGSRLDLSGAGWWTVN